MTTKKKAVPKKTTTGMKRRAASTVYSSNDSDNDSTVNSRAARVLPFSASRSFTDSRKRTQALTRALKQKYPDAGVKDVLLALACGMDPVKFMDIVRDERIQRSDLTREDVRDMIQANLDPILAVENLQENPDDVPDSKEGT